MTEKNRTIRYNLIALLLLFIISFVSIVLVNSISNYISQNLNQEINNQKNRIIIGENIIKKIEHIRTNFYILRNRDESSNTIINDIYANVKDIEEFLIKLEYGGKVVINQDLNLIGRSDYKNSFHLEPIKKGTLFLEAIEIKPKLEEIKYKIVELTNLMETQNDNGKSLDLFYKKITSLFNRLIENSNNMLYSANKDLETVKTEIEQEQENQQIINYSLIVLILIITYILFSRIFKNTGTITKELETTTKQLETMMDTVSNIIIITDGEALYKSNRAFKLFFDLKDEQSYKEFVEKHKCICKFFIETDKRGFLKEDMGKSTWMDYVIDRPAGVHKVMIKSHGDDKIHYFKVDARKILIDNRYRSVAVFTDITEIETYQESLESIVKEAIDKAKDKDRIMSEQSKMAAMGEMMKNIAHHWRQPLNVLSLNLQDLIDAKEYGELDDKYLERVVNTSMKELKFLSETIDNFKNFFLKDSEVKEFELVPLIKQVNELVIPEMRSLNIDFTTSCPEHIVCKGRPSELKQVILNIINNSKDAIERNESADNERKVTLDAYQEGRVITIEIGDTGGGIENEIIDRIFEPYFTTKFKSKSTGLGLYMAKTTIEKSLKGHLSVSNKDNGAIFRIDLITPKNFRNETD